MIGNYAPNQILHQQLDALQFRLDFALNAYVATKNPASLIEALKTQTQMMDLLLSANNLQTARSLDRSHRIQRL